MFVFVNVTTQVALNVARNILKNLNNLTCLKLFSSRCSLVLRPEVAVSEAVIIVAGREGWSCSPCICIAARCCWWNSNTQQWRLPVLTTQQHLAATTAAITPDLQRTTTTSPSLSTSRQWAACRVSVAGVKISAGRWELTFCCSEG